MSNILNSFEKKKLSYISNNYINNSYKIEDKDKVINNFFSNYLNSLSVYLDDKTHNSKCINLPDIKSNIISKISKNIAIETNNNADNELSSNTKNKNDNYNYNILYIVYEFNKYNAKTKDKSINDQSLNNNDSNIDLRTKLIDPMNVFLFDNNEKMQKFSLEQIINNITNVDEKRLQKAKILEKEKKIKDIEDYNYNYNTIKSDYNNSNNLILNNQNTQRTSCVCTNNDRNINDTNSINYNTINKLDSKLSLDKKFSSLKNFESYEYKNNLRLFNLFENMCKNNKILTINQKIDYFVYLKSNNIFNKILNNDGKVYNKSSYISKYKLSSITKKGNSNLNKENQQVKHNNSKLRNSKFNTNYTSSTNKHLPSINTPNNLLYKSDFNIEDNKTIIVDNLNQTNNLEIYNNNFYNNDIFYNKLLKEFISRLKINQLNYDIELSDKNNEFLIDIYEDFMQHVLNNQKIDYINTVLFNDNKNNKENTVMFHTLNYYDKLKHLSKYCEISNKYIIIKNTNINTNILYMLIKNRNFNLKTILYFNVTNCNINDNELSIIISLIDQFSKNIKYLNVSSNNLNFKTAEKLNKLISNELCKLESLSISNSNMGDQSFSEICLGISNNISLKYLYASNNNLKKITAIVLGTLLRYDKKLILLDISGNNFTENLICCVFKGLISNSSLEILLLNNLNIGIKNIKTLETSLLINSSIKQLYLNNNNLDKKCCEIISKIINKNKNIKLISLLGNNIDNDAIDIITDNIKAKNLLKYKIISKKDDNILKLNSIINQELMFEYFNDSYQC